MVVRRHRRPCASKATRGASAMNLTGRRSLVPRLLVVALGLVGLLAMHGLGPSHGAIPAEHVSAGAGNSGEPQATNNVSQPLASASTVMREALQAGSGMTVERVSAYAARIRSAIPSAAPTSLNVLGACLAVIGASLLLLVLARLLAGAGPAPLRWPTRPPEPQMFLRASRGGPQKASQPELCVWRT